jgi:hypothetical protein
MPSAPVTREEFLEDRLGKAFSDVVNDPEQSFNEVLHFFTNEDRLRRMEESEIHHNRPPLAGVVRELESQPALERFLSGVHVARTKRLRQAIGVLVRLIMERRGWRKTGRKGSLGVRAAASSGTANHNTGGLAFWFIRAERYEHKEGMAFRSVRERCRESKSVRPQRSSSRDVRLGPPPLGDHP